MSTADLGLIGLGTMGRNLALNVYEHGFGVAGYDLDSARVAALQEMTPADRVAACRTLDEFLNTLKRPRLVMLLVPAGRAVDAAIARLRPALDAGDILMDGGNSFFQDSERRARRLERSGIRYLSVGISGGEQGARRGPSLMVGGPPEAWELVRPVLEAISAQVDDEPCAAWLGPGAAGHYVKMVHNGIEYAEMQLIAESYDLLHRGLGLDNASLAEIFRRWNASELQSYLLEITATILAHIDPQTGQFTVDLILDEAQQKGTGKWASQNALDLGAPTPTMSAAVESRLLSARKEERLAAARILRGPLPALRSDTPTVVAWLGEALYTARVAAYAQGFDLLRLASQEYGYHLNRAEIARIWRGGCILRASLLEAVRRAFLRCPDLPNLMLDAEFSARMKARQSALRRIVALAAESGIPLLAFGSALAYYDAYRSERLPANLIQAQRDYFGAHTYRRLDRQGAFHTDWEAPYQ